MKTQIHILTGSHPTIEGDKLIPYITPGAADAGARDLVNAIRQNEVGEMLDRTLPQLAGEFDWRDALREWQREHLIGLGVPGTGLMDDDELAKESGAAVWVTSFDVDDAPAIPPPLDKLLKDGEGVADLLESALDVHIYDGDEPANNVYRRALASYADAAQMARWTAIWHGTVAYVGEHRLSDADYAKMREALDGEGVTVSVIHESPPCANMARTEARVAIGLDGGVVQWALADRPGLRVHVIDFDTDGHKPGKFDLTLIDDGDSQDPANAYELGPKVDFPYFERLDVAPPCDADGTVWGDDDEDQVSDDASFLVSADLGIPGDEGGLENYSGFIPGEDMDAARQIATAIIYRRFGADTRIFSMRVMAPAGGV